MEQTVRELQARRRKLIHQAKLIAERYLRREREHLARSKERIGDMELDMYHTRERIDALRKDIEDIFDEIHDINKKLGD